VLLPFVTPTVLSAIAVLNPQTVEAIATG